MQVSACEILTGIYCKVSQCELDGCLWAGFRWKCRQNVYVVSHPQVSCQDLSEQVSQTLISSSHRFPLFMLSHSFKTPDSPQDFVLSVSCSFLPPKPVHFFSFLKLSLCSSVRRVTMTQSCVSPCSYAGFCLNRESIKKFTVLTLYFLFCLSFLL